MTDRPTDQPATNRPAGVAPPAAVNYTFSASEIEQLRQFGEAHDHSEGAVLFSEGDKAVDCLIVLSGQLDVLVTDAGATRRIGWMTPGQFSGDLAVLTGQTTLATGKMAEAGTLLHISQENFQRLLVENSALSDVFIRAFVARRAWARTSGLATTVVVGSRADRTVFAIRDLLTKHEVNHAWINSDDDPVAEKILTTKGFTRDDLPVVLRGSSLALRRPDLRDVSEAYGLDLLPDGACADVLIVGAGPAGLAASVYAASEGLSVLTIDTDGPGGQAGTSSKIENYLGFPTGISGRELANNAAVQAQKFGVRIASPARAEKLEPLADGTAYCLTLVDGRAFKAKAVVIATGAQYRKLPIDHLESFEGRGIYYGATPMEAQLCMEQDVAVVGAGNSAGQGAVFLSQSARRVHVLYRRPDIRETMSEYLVRRLEETPNIHLHPETEIDAFQGDGHLSRIDLRVGGKTGDCLATPYVFLFIGAAPFTNWLPETLATGPRGFIKTGSDLGNLDLVKAQWRLDRMPSRYETSLPRVYAVGDVRIGSVKRVANAVGEGSVVVSDIHAALAEIAEVAAQG
ncbi:MAG: FAD-dependent oxidoreductase [Pseudomonadota bacterium]